MPTDKTKKTTTDNKKNESNVSKQSKGIFSVEELVNSLPSDVQRKLRNGVKKTSSQK